MANIERYSREESMFALIGEWQNSAITKKQFCERAQVGIHTFNYWLKKFNSQNGNSKPGFTEFRIVGKPNIPIVRLNFPNGIVAELPPSCDYSLVHFLINNCQ
jgi:hypothetical protein